MTIELRHLRNFLHVAETLSFSRGAERAHISQSSMTEQMQRLEDVVGVRLIDRNRRRVRLTLAGEALQARVRELLDGVDRLLDETRAAGGVVRRSLRIGYSEMALNSLMPSILQRFRHDHPHVETILTEQSSTGAEQALLDHQVDVAFVPGSHHRQEVAALEIGREQVLCCVAETSPLARHAHITLRHLATEPIIMLARGNRFGESIAEAFARAGIEPRLVARIDRVSAILTLVAAEQGVGFIPLALTGMVPQGVQIRPLGRPQLTVSFSLLWRRADESDAVAALVRTARDIIGASRPPAAPARTAPRARRVG